MSRACLVALLLPLLVATAALAAPASPSTTHSGTAPPPSSLAGHGELSISGVVAGRSWSQAPCKVADGCSGLPEGFWRIDQQDPRVGLAIAGRWFVARGPVGLAARYRLSERPGPKGPAAAALPDDLEHHLECRLAVRLRAPAARAIWITPELGWDLHTWFAWQTTSDLRIAEHRIAAHAVGVGVALAAELGASLGLEARLSVDLLPGVGGIRLSEGSVELGLSGSSGPALVRVAGVARAGGIVATREQRGATQGVRLGVVDLALEVGAGFRF
jgi:hypothetical protein